MPQLMIKILVSFQVLWLNAFPVKFGVSATISLRTIMTQKLIDYNIYCQIPFGAYVQIHESNDPTNDTEALRTLAAVSLGPTGNRQGGYYFLNLTICKRITHNHFTPYAMNKLVSCRADCLGLRQGMKIKLDSFDRN